jgi:sarcosine oxidase subunit gamma
MANFTAARKGPAVAPSALVRTLPPASRWTLRGEPAVLNAATAALGLPIIDRACRATAQQATAALWLGPDERLLIAPAEAHADVAARLEAALGEAPHALVDVSHRQIALEIAGERAAVVLNSGSPLDLHLSAFPIGMCTRTVFAKAEIVLWRTEEHRFRIEVWRSFATYVSKYLALASKELEA